jgi:hypothetical protein
VSTGSDGFHASDAYGDAERGNKDAYGVPGDATVAIPRHRSAHRRARSSRLIAVLAGVGVLVIALVVAAALGLVPSLRGPDRPATAAGAACSSQSVGGCAAESSSGATHASPTASAASASPSASRSAKPATHSPTATPTVRRGGKPGLTNTGVPAGTKLTVVVGDQAYDTPNQVISGLDIHGFVQIRAKNVTIKNSIIRGGSNPPCNSAVVWIRADSSASATIEDTEIAPSHPSPCLDGVWATNAKLIRMNIHGAVDGVKAYDNVTLEDSYVHDLSWFASDPNQGGGATHNDDVQTYEGNEHIVLRHNTMSPGPKGNAAYQVTQDGGKVSTDLHIEDNWLDGGGCTLNFSHKGGPTPMTGIYVIGNRFGRHSVFACPILLSTQTFLSADTGNVWDDTGKPIPSPQRHD